MRRSGDCAVEDKPVMKTNGSKKRWGRMTPAQLAEATKEFDNPLPASRYKPLTKRQRAEFERARRAGRLGRARFNAMTLDPELLKAAERYAKRNRLSMNALLERALRHELAG